jgi:hypothetical protein
VESQPQKLNKPRLEASRMGWFSDLRQVLIDPVNADAAMGYTLRAVFGGLAMAKSRIGPTLSNGQPHPTFAQHYQPKQPT